MKKKVFNPKVIAPPVGTYTHVYDVTCKRLVFLAGQLGIDKNGNLVGKGDIVAQADQVYKNLEALLKSQKLTWDNVTWLHTYVCDMSKLKELMAVKKKHMKKFPPGTIVQVSALADPDYLIEIDAIAAAD